LFTINLAQQPAEYFARTDFDPLCRRIGIAQGKHGLCPADGAGDLLDECSAECRAGLLGVGQDIGDNGNLRISEGKFREQRGEAILCGLHQRAVERGADGEHDDAFCAGFLEQSTGADDGSGGAGDDDLRGGVEVCGRDDFAGFLCGLGAGGEDGFSPECEHCGHCPFARRHRLLHELAAGVHGADSVSEREDAGGDERGVFAERVAGDDGRHNATGPEDALSGNGDGDDGGLGEGGETELVVRPMEAEGAEREAECFIGFGKDGLCFRKVLLEIAAHTDGLRALPWEEKCVRTHAPLSEPIERRGARLPECSTWNN
jgi:hypothetical protein